MLSENLAEVGISKYGSIGWKLAQLWEMQRERVKQVFYQEGHFDKLACKGSGRERLVVTEWIASSSSEEQSLSNPEQAATGTKCKGLHLSLPQHMMGGWPSLSLSGSDLPTAVYGHSTHHRAEFSRGHKWNRNL